MWGGFRGGGTLAGVAMVLAACVSSAVVGRTDLEPPEPAIRVEPSGPRIGRWQLVEADVLRLAVEAPGALRAHFFYEPLEVVDRRIDLGVHESDGPHGTIRAEWEAGPDLAGDVWARVRYPEGVEVETEALAIAHADAIIAEPGEVPLDAVGGSVATDDSARADALTGGRIEAGLLVPGDPRIWLTINVPEFRLTLWQDGKEIESYPIGIGKKDFPLPIGPRKATEIIWNPSWVPPRSSWVEASSSVEPGEWIPATDPRNPLGKLKIRLGDAVLIHEAARPTDIGGLVSHGCVRMLTQDLFDLAEKIVAARSLPVTNREIETAKAGSERLAVRLEPPLWVDVNYDTGVIEGGRLRLYPDVYDQGGDDLESLRTDLRESGLPGSALDEGTYALMREQVSQTQEYVVTLDDVAAGRALTAGRPEPLTDCAVEPPPA